jgi:hypothetical protein
MVGINKFFKMFIRAPHGMPRIQQEATEPLLALPCDALPDEPTQTAIHLRSCTVFERIAVRTHGSLYELIVLSGAVGEVLIRGGRFFPEFRRGLLIGSSAVDGRLTLGTIDLGLSMEMRDDRTRYITSPVEAVAREAHSAPTA